MVMESRGASLDLPVAAFTVKRELLFWLKQRRVEVENARQVVFAQPAGTIVDTIQVPAWQTLTVWRMYDNPRPGDTPVRLGSPDGVLAAERTDATPG
jgi:hypothetical protein